MAHSRTISDRAPRLRELAESAENLVNLAGLADETLAQARADLLALAGAARTLATRLDAEASAMEAAQ